MGGDLWQTGKGKDCHLIYVNPIEKVSKINGDCFRMGNIDGSIIRGGRLRAAKSQLEIIERCKCGTKVFDVDCGEGFPLFNASKSGYTGRGIELSRDAPESATREFDLDVEAKPFEELRFQDDYFDAVTLWQVLEHVPYPLMVGGRCSQDT